MLEGWRESTLGDLVTIRRDRVDPRLLGDVPLVHYSIPALDESGGPIMESAACIASQKFLVTNDAVLVSMLNPRIPRVWLAKGQPNAVCSTEFAVLVPRVTNLDVGYLHLICQSRGFAKEVARRAVGTTGSRQRTKSAEVLGISALLPSIDVQRRIVDVVQSVDLQLLRLQIEVRAASAVAQNVAVQTLYSLSTGTVTLGDYIRLDVEQVPVLPDQYYPIVGVLNRGRGLLIRDALLGAKTQYPRLNVVRPNQFVYSKLKAFEGSATVALELTEPAFASQEFPTFSMCSGTDPRFVRWLTRLPSFWTALAAVSTGMGGRRERVKPSDLLSISVPQLGPQEQSILASNADAAATLARDLQLEAEALSRLRYRLLDDLLSGSMAVPDSYDAILGEVI